MRLLTAIFYAILILLFYIVITASLAGLVYLSICVGWHFGISAETTGLIDIFLLLFMLFVSLFYTTL